MCACGTIALKNYANAVVCRVESRVAIGSRGGPLAGPAPEARLVHTSKITPVLASSTLLSRLYMAPKKQAKAGTGTKVKETTANEVNSNTDYNFDPNPRHLQLQKEEPV